jgi:diaminohydroxyphosphoribosylaminopyrimidine deaminase / 5-amino-6-(5-phosphoribosylamino)uracil reductase
VDKHEAYIRRCFELAERAGKNTKSNPLVGAVLTHNDRIIGEGFHSAFGAPHAEVEAIRSVKADDQQLISKATLYVSLEPCCHHGKTPACTDLILQKGIQNVVVSTLDPNPKVAGKGVEILRQAGVRVVEGVLSEEGRQLIAPFAANLNGTPYVILKIVKSSDHFIGQEGKQIWISNKYSKALSHQWRSHVDAIMVGKNTAITDNPKLDVRLVVGENPIRIVLDRELAVPPSHHLLNDGLPTWILSEKRRTKSYSESVHYLHFESIDDLDKVLRDLFQRGVHKLLVEGGSQVINSFLRVGLWHECRVITAPVQLGKGIPAPNIHGRLIEEYSLQGDKVVVIQNQKKSIIW